MKGSPKSRSAISEVIIAFLTMDIVVIAMSIGSAIVRPEDNRSTWCITIAVKRTVRNLLSNSVRNKIFDFVVGEFGRLLKKSSYLLSRY